MGDLNCLPPGFRFHPTDEELVCYYLRKKLSNSKSELESDYLNPITDIDLYKYEPSDLAATACFQGRDQQWFFFTEGNRKKYPNGSRKNRATEGGYWKTTGKDRRVLSKGVTVGMKKTLVFHRGRSSRAERTSWVMHEYRLVHGEAGESSLLEKDHFVLCRVFLKSGSGAKTCEQHGVSLSREDSRSTDNQSALVTENKQYDDVILPSSGEGEVEETYSPLKPLTATSEENTIPWDGDHLSKFLLECLKEPDNDQAACDSLQIPVGADEWSGLINDPFAEVDGVNTLADEVDILIRNDTHEQSSADQKLHTERNVHRVDYIDEANITEQSNFEELFSPAYLGGDFLELNDLISPLDSDFLL